MADKKDPRPASRVVKEVPFDFRLTWPKVETLANCIPWYPDNDPKKPEWKKTPIHELDLGRHGTVHIKDESFNPTGTHKDRMGWEVACFYRDFAKRLIMLYENGEIKDSEISKFILPPVSIISGGNAAIAIAHYAKQYGLPPPKILVDCNSALKDSLLTHDYLSIYATDLSKKSLSPKEILELTNNINGLELTSSNLIEFYKTYDWLTHEILNFSPDFIFLPFGTGRLMENIHYWMRHNAYPYKPDPRLGISQSRLPDIKVFAAEPEEKLSIADKLTAAFKPFQYYNEVDFSAAQQLALSGEGSGVYPVKEEFIHRAFEILEEAGIQAEASGSAALALFIQMKIEGQLPSKIRILIINTGKGKIVAG